VRRSWSGQGQLPRVETKIAELETDLLEGGQVLGAFAAGGCATSHIHWPNTGKTGRGRVKIKQ
jgi:hypothetical protein